MRFPVPLAVVMLFAGFLLSCAAEEQKAVEEVEDLSVGEKAALYRMNISVDEAYATRAPTDLGMKRDKEPEQGKVFVVVDVTVEGTQAQTETRLPIVIKDRDFSAEDENGYRIPQAIPKAFSYGGIRPVYDLTGELPPGQSRTGPLAFEASETSEITFKFKPVPNTQNLPTVRWNLGPVSEIRRL